MQHAGLRCRNIRIVTWMLVAGWLVMLISPEPAFASDSEKPHFDSLIKRLVKDGFDENRLKELFYRPEVHFETQGISRFSVHKESKLNYGQFLSRANIRKARRYMRKHHASLENAEQKYGVPKEVITAVMLVETKLGTYLGGSATLNILSTMAVLSDPDSRDYIWSRVTRVRPQKRNRFNAWSDRKADWAYQELKALLTYTEKEKIDPASIQGSYAGAIGICQFMPSNALKLAADGNGDGRIDLFDHADAIASIANYLKSHGWRSDLSRKQQYKVLLRYNYSRPYANTLLDIAEKLKG